ncbi:methyl-accepting chemotaxis protein [Bacillus sp. FJAT-29790]|uniref:methyl-accepting chemotaxis protein n=1 Tax=Bacillus sp. FJAT-29790 TaxID=1895002 RepID=UPI001C22877B|nr:HAMP domain-containing methyl-accepting chemotaxis protein [Bacillus sp. FJAT-29790]MBU8880643.1 methyl-accepting chemotaxis protein [Bacillus sp. FJAT-29790]
MKITIGKKLMAGFLSVAILLGAISSISYYNLQKVDKSFSNLVDRQAAVLLNAKSMQTSASLEVSGLRGVLLQEVGSAFVVESSITELDNNIQNTFNLVQSQKHKDLLTKLETLNKEFKIQSDEVVKLMDSNKLEAQRIAFQEVIPLAREIRDLADKIALDQAKYMQEGSKDSSILVKNVIKTILILSVISFVLAIFIGIAITRMITIPIFSLEKVAGAIASGDLTQEDIKVKNRDELRNLAEAFNKMKMNLRDLIREVSLDVERVAVTSKELSSGAEQTSRATEQITIAIQEVALGSEKQVTNATEANQAVAEISNGMNQAAASIQSVADLTMIANDKATVGNTVVNKTVEQINLVQNSVSETGEVVNALGEKSGEIGRIVELITKIANQTNLLALNAAIEAARAGEHGRGFAVVADEVRMLAEQSGDAARQIRDIIQEVQAEAEKAVLSMNHGASIVEEGINMVHQTGEAFRDIVQSIEQVTAEAQEVSAIVEQVNSSSQNMVATMEGVANIAEKSAGNTQNVATSTEEQNALMEEIASSAEALSKMAQNLQEAISNFKV